MPSVLLEVFPMMIDNIRVIIEQGPFSAEDAQYYIERIKATTKFTLKKITVTRYDTYLDIRCLQDRKPRSSPLLRGFLYMQLRLSGIEAEGVELPDAARDRL